MSIDFWGSPGMLLTEELTNPRRAGYFPPVQSTAVTFLTECIPDEKIVKVKKFDFPACGSAPNLDNLFNKWRSSYPSLALSYARASALVLLMVPSG